MSTEKIVGLRFQEVTWRRAVRTHLRKAYETKPHNVDTLQKVLQKILDSGPFLNDGCRQIITKSTFIEAKLGKCWFAAISVRKLVALVRWDHRCFTILAVIDLDRLSRRKNQRQCYIVDYEVDSEGGPLPLKLFIDSQNHIVCRTMSSPEAEDDRSFRYDPWSAWAQGSAGIAS